MLELDNWSGPAKKKSAFTPVPPRDMATTTSESTKADANDTLSVIEEGAGWTQNDR